VEIFHRFGLPRIAHEVREQRHQRDPLVRREFGQADIRIDLQVARAIGHRHPLRAKVGDLGRVLFQRAKAVRIAIGVKGEAHLVVLRFFPRMRRGWRRGARGFLCGQPRRRKFFPKRQVRQRLSGGVRLLQGFELPLQLPQGKGKIELRSNEKGLHEKNRSEKDDDPSNEQDKTKPRPAFPGRIGKDERRHRVGKVLFHFAHDTTPREKMGKRLASLLLLLLILLVLVLVIVIVIVIESSSRIRIKSKIRSRSITMTSPIRGPALLVAPASAPSLLHV
jgi:hypothetical protein